MTATKGRTSARTKMELNIAKKMAPSGEAKKSATAAMVTTVERIDWRGSGFGGGRDGGLCPIFLDDDMFG